MMTIPQALGRPCVYVGAVTAFAALRSGLDPLQTAKGGLWAISCLAAQILAEKLCATSGMESIAKSLSPKIEASRSQPIASSNLARIQRLSFLKLKNTSETNDFVSKAICKVATYVALIYASFFLVPKLLGMDSSFFQRQVFSFAANHISYRVFPSQARPPLTLENLQEIGASFIEAVMNIGAEARR